MINEKLHNAEQVIEKLLDSVKKTENSVLSQLSEVEIAVKIANKLDAFSDIFNKWQGKINLVSKSSLNDFWLRHILDSAQLLKFVSRESKVFLDLGTGGGFPGLILAIFLSEINPEVKMHLTDSDTRKCAFLKEAARACEISAEVVCQRIEQIQGFPADVITARALTALPELINYATPFMKETTECLFLKGEKAASEAKLVKKELYNIEFKPSLTDSTGVIVSIKLKSKIDN